MNIAIWIIIYLSKMKGGNIDFQFLIKNLKNDEKTILTLYYCEKYTTKEISVILRKNESTIRSKISRAINKLKKEYLYKED